MLPARLATSTIDRDEDLNRLQQAAKTINRQHPDLDFLTGDYFSGPDTMRRFIGGFSRALADLKPVYGCVRDRG